MGMYKIYLPQTLHVYKPSTASSLVINTILKAKDVHMPAMFVL